MVATSARLRFGAQVALRDWDMRFRYADGTPLPIAANFLDTLTRMVGVCADLLGTERLVDAGWDDTSPPPLGTIIRRALPLSELPETRSSIRFDAGGYEGAGRLIVSESTYFWLTLHAGVELDADTVFRGPFRVRDVAADLSLQIPGERDWLGRRTTGPRSIDKHFVLSVEAADENRSLSIARKPGAAPVQLVLRGPGFPDPTLVAADGTRHAMSAADAEVATGLWTRLVRGMWNRALGSRWHLVGGELEGQPLATATDASRLGLRLVDAIAPLAAEIYYRSGRADALVLEGEDGSVHALAIEDLERAVARLPARARAAFAPLELGRLAVGSSRMERVVL